MLSQEIWAPIVQAALDEYLNKKSKAKSAVVPAAPLKPLLVRQSERAGIAFPPEGYEHLKFADFLDMFPSVVQTRRRPGQDVLVVKAEDVELLEGFVQFDSDQPHGKCERVAFRSDVFRAFTKLLPSGQCFWYSKSTDDFVEGEVGSVDPSLVQLAIYTLENAISERRDFANTIENTTQKDILLGATNDSLAPLRAFSQAVKELHVEREWHNFRFDRLERRIRGWASTAQIDWNPAWTSKAKPVRQGTVIITARETNSFLAELMQLGPEDAKRVMVPLDIVLKLMRRD